MKFAILAVGMLLPAIVTPALARNAITDGSFEDPVVTDGSRLAIQDGQVFDGWNVTGPAKAAVYLTSTDYTHGKFRYPSEDGQQWLNLGKKGMSMGQQVMMIPGFNYAGKIWVGTLGKKGGTVTVTTTLNGEIVGDCTIPSQGGTTMVWQKCEFSFLGVGNHDDRAQMSFSCATSEAVCGIDAIDIAPDGAL